jgi:hypothetical protein
MTTPIPYRYQLDETGASPDNLVQGEPHALAAKLYRTIVPKYGAYFSATVHVWDSLSQRELRRGIDYKCLDILGLPSAKTNQEICSTILVVDQSCSGNVTVNYQALGGAYERNFPGIATLINNVYNDTRPALWESVVGKPSTFNPTDHLHDFGDVVGLEYVINAMERIRQAILLGDEADHITMVAHFDAQITKLSQTLSDLIGAESYQAMLFAKQAQTSVAAALDNYNNQLSLAGDLANQVNQNSAYAKALFTDFTNDEKVARELISTYPGLLGLADSMALLQNPSGLVLKPSFFPGTEATGVVSTDTLYIKNTGELFYSDNAVLPSAIQPTVCGFVRLNLLKELVTGRATVQVTLSMVDQRDKTSLLGWFGDEADITLCPFTVGKQGGKIYEVLAGDAYTRVGGVGADTKQAVFSYSVAGGGAVSLTASGLANTADDRIIADNLIDTRKDYNISGLAGTSPRQAVKLQLTSGGEINLFLQLSSAALADIRQVISTLILLKMKVKTQAVGGAVTAINVDYSAKPRALSGAFT